MWPLTGFIRPRSVFIKVVLPAPFGPRRQIILPVFSCKLMPLTTGEFLYPTDKSVTDIAGMAYLSKKTALEVRPRMPSLQGRLLRQSYEPLAANRDAAAVRTLGSEACNGAGRAPRGAQELRGDLRTNSFLNLFNTGVKVNGDHDFSKLSESEHIQVTESYLRCYDTARD